MIDKIGGICYVVCELIIYMFVFKIVFIYIIKYIFKYIYVNIFLIKEMSFCKKKKKKRRNVDISNNVNFYLVKILLRINLKEIFKL